MPIDWENKFAYEALTFDDVLLIPQYSDVLPSEVDVSTALTRTIRLNIPLVSSAMDTVTEDRLAIALAREGGLGIIHKNMSAELQADMVRKVKRSESGMITDPITLRPDQTVGEAWEFMREYRISGVPITTTEGELVGILTNRDLRFEDDPTRKIYELMTSESLVTVPQSTTLEEAKHVLHKHRIEKVLVVDEHGKLSGLITVKDIQKRIQYPSAAKDTFGRLLVGAAVGAAPKEMERATLLVNAGVDVIAVDTAHGHSQGVLDAIKRMKREFPDLQVIAGNVSTYEGAKALIECGADAIKVGQGPGSICFAGDTPVVMRNGGIRAIAQIQVGDEVVTHRGRVRRVTKTYRHTHQGSMLNIQVNGNAETLRVTPNHEFLAVQGETQSLAWVRADALQVHDIVVMPRRSYQITAHSYDLATYTTAAYTTKTAVWAQKAAQPMLMAQPSVGVSAEQGTVPMSWSLPVAAHYPLKRHIELDAALMRLFGYYVADGYCIGSAHQRQLRFIFDATKQQHAQTTIRLIEQVFGYTEAVLIQAAHSIIEVRVDSPLITNLFEHVFNRMNPDCSLPEYLLNQPQALLREFVIGVLQSTNVQIQTGGIVWATSYVQMVYQLAEILLRLDILAGVQSSPNRSLEYGVTVTGRQYRKLAEHMPELGLSSDDGAEPNVFWADDSHIYATINEIAIQSEQSLEVYNLEVADDHSYLVDRIAAHNCTTRVVSGAGMAQITAVINCVKAAEGSGVPIIADGGIKYSGDLAKAIAAGANTVMIGGLFAGTNEAPGEQILYQGRSFKTYRGMGSIGAMQQGSSDRYFQDNQDNARKLVAEGIEGMVPYKGRLSDTVFQLVGGLRSGMGYVGAHSIDEMRTNARFARISAAGLAESHPHDVTITNESPNYERR